MLLPSDVARLVLGYLQEEGLSVTSQAFIQESPNLKEYADHTTGDGTIPACVFSVFGKGLTTILNEYVATKTKESRHEVPAVMTSLWKKLDFTLNQIKSLQNSPVISACQRTRSRIGVANMTRQRVLTVSSPTAVNSSSVSETSSIISPAHTSQSILNHSTPLSFTTLHSLPASFPEAQQQIHDVRLNAPRDSPAQIVSENRLSAGPMSPGRRKWDTPRKRAGVVGGCSGPSRYSASGTFAEPQLEEAVDENFPQLVIQNARDKMLGDRSLQEKLAENINKILASDPVPQVSKTSSSTLEADQSIDEILGLQGEIHMSDDAIHDILAQTESDPAFQALYDLFDCNKTRFTDPGDAVNNCCLEGSDTAGPASLVKPLQSDDPGNTNKDVPASDAVPVTVKTKAGQERKTRKSVAPTLLKKTVLAPSGRSSRIENSSARLLVSHGELTGAKAAGDSNKKAKSSVLNNSNFVVTPMNIDEPLVTLPPPSVNMATLEPTSKNNDSSSIARIESAASSIADQKQLNKQAQVSEDQHDDASLAKSNQSIVSLHVPVEPNSTPSSTADLPQMAISSNEGDPRPVLNHSASPESASSTSVSSAAPCTTTSDSESVSTSTVLMTAANPTLHNSSTPCAGSASVGEAPGPVSSHSGTSKPAGDSNVVSLKIIISDDQDEDSFSDPALRQAVSSISADKIPTIYLTSPAKSPGVPGTPKITSDEVAQAVSSLQNSEMHGPVCTRAGTLDGSQLTGTSQVQQNYIIQLPLDSTTRAIQGAPASYFLVTEPPPTDAQTRPMLLSAGVPKGQPLPFHQYGATTQTNSQSYSTGSTLILPSPANPVMLPVSVTGQNAMGRVQMVPNQLVTIQNALPIQQPETVTSSSPAVAVNGSTSADTEQVAKLVQPQSSDNKTQQDAAKSNAHRRILCFDSSSEVQMQPTTTTLLPVTNATTRQSAQQMQKDNRLATRTRPNILGGNKLKRRVQPVTLAVPQIEGSFAKADKSKNLVKKNVQKQDLSTCSTEARCAGTSRTDASKPNIEKKADSKILDGKYTHSKDGDGVKAKDDDDSRVVSSDSAKKSKKEKEESSKKELGLKSSAKPRDGRTEKSAPSEEVPNITANKENEIKGTTQEQQAAPSSSASRDFSPQDAAQPTTNPHPKGSKTPSKTSSLAKQAAEMLHNIQGLNSPSTPVMKATTGSSELPCRNQEETADSAWTPSRQKKGKDVEGTPKHLMHPNTPDVPSCSPASETGSENSINMAAHTLMILSRATIARTGTPLKDSLRQDGAGEKLPTSSKNSKKRKLSSPTATAPAKKDKERKKLIDCFPLDLDVDKFLSSLHYDE